MQSDSLLVARCTLRTFISELFSCQCFTEVTVVLVPPPGTGIPSYATPEDTPTGSQEVCVMIVGAPPNVLQRPVTLTLESSDGPAGVIGAQSKYIFDERDLLLDMLTYLADISKSSSRLA